nr:hypothetical protein [Limosilactobacillus mucosae]
MDIIERLDQERGELEYRINRLALFLHEQEKTQTVSDKQIDLLYRQRLFMQGYKNVLDMRIRDLEMRKDFGETL